MQRLFRAKDAPGRSPGDRRGLPVGERCRGMSGLRTVHVIVVIFSRLAFALVLFGSICLAIVIILLTWSLEALRVAIQTRPENRP